MSLDQKLEGLLGAYLLLHLSQLHFKDSRAYMALLGYDKALSLSLL